MDVRSSFPGWIPLSCVETAAAFTGPSDFFAKPSNDIQDRSDRAAMKTRQASAAIPSLISYQDHSFLIG